VLETIDLSRVRSNGYAFQIEMSVRAWRKGFTLKEIPIVFVDRTEGQSKMNRAIVRKRVDGATAQTDGLVRPHLVGPRDRPVHLALPLGSVDETRSGFPSG